MCLGPAEKSRLSKPSPAITTTPRVARSIAHFEINGCVAPRHTNDLSMPGMQSMTVGWIQLGRCEYGDTGKQGADREALQRVMTWPVSIQRIDSTGNRKVGFVPMAIVQKPVIEGAS